MSTLLTKLTMKLRNKYRGMTMETVRLISIITESGRNCCTNFNSLAKGDNWASSVSFPLVFLKRFVIEPLPAFSSRIVYNIIQAPSIKPVYDNFKFYYLSITRKLKEIPTLFWIAIDKIIITHPTMVLQRVFPYSTYIYFLIGGTKEEL